MEVSAAVRHIYISLGFKRLNLPYKAFMQWDEIRPISKSVPIVLMDVRNVDVKVRNVDVKVHNVDVKVPTFIKTSGRIKGRK